MGKISITMINKIVKVIKSCETGEQLSISFEWALKYFDCIGFQVWSEVIQPEIDSKYYKLNQGGE